MNDYEVQKEYEKIRQRHEKALRIRKETLREEAPEYKALFFKRNELFAAKTRARLLKNREEEERLDGEIQALNEREKEILKRRGLPDDYLTLRVSCPVCNDFGYLADGKRCQCLERRLQENRAEESLYFKLGPGDTFENFNPSLFRDDIKTPYGVSSRAFMEKMKKLYQKLARGYEASVRDPQKEDPGLNRLLYGAPGVGKTFLVSCFANTLKEKKLPYRMITAPNLLEMIYMDVRSEGVDGPLKRVRETPLLIIDDLGTENITDFSVKQISELIASRLLNRRKTIITTNYSPSELSEIYPERLLSRINGEFAIDFFVGEDLRLIKKPASKQQA